MPYHKNKQQAFQAAQQGYEQAIDANETRLQSVDQADYGKELAHLTQEVNEAYQQIDKALEVASEHQYEQLKQYQNQLTQIMSELEQ
ncbi:hypothetical protein N780_11490 [Pontibacillus chungwhensis BH030062]|uniref:Small, acid-soluble spore protein N n=1 Tax=Pontibacillus chungwhensis BH030062 TaxID=1385513 RepID=A0A0A2UYG3_9BACI|nr:MULTISPECIES: hypothetical protein [Pontibacillus]KGP92959.1 hypothetical protein N780_11490 [Pontibacillus chungwhensis BH030062]QST01686.1 hypothetical protein IMZ31_09075 [Pontibacillus sp. ALD_SL1]